MDGPKVIFTIVDGINFTETIVLQWIVMALIIAVVLFLTHGMSKDKPTKRQVVAEMLVNMVNNLIDSNLGKNHRNFAPYIATLFSFSLIGSLISLTGLRPLTADINTTGMWAVMTLSMVTFQKFKKGPLAYLKGFTQPVVFMTPMNIISEFANPVSLALRHFGNVAGGLIITELVYQGLGFISRACHVGWEYFSLFQVGIPAALSIYFDLFSGFMQAFIFIMLTMAYVSDAIGEET